MPRSISRSGMAFIKLAVINALKVQSHEKEIDLEAAEA
jgi:hypothetical protein